jgi:hypothetical protein
MVEDNTRPTDEFPDNSRQRLSVTWVIMLLIPALCAGIFLRYRTVRDHGPRQYEQLSFDARYYYVSTGIALTEGRGFAAEYNERDPKPPFFIPPPLQAMFVAIVFKITGSQSIPALLHMQFLLNLIAGGLLFWLLLRWQGRLPAVVGFWLWMLYPEFCYWVASPITENNHLLLLIIVTGLLMEWERRGSIGWAVAAAVLIGLMNLQKPLGLLLGIWISVYCLLRLKGKERWIHCMVFLGFPFVVLVPWLLHNKIVSCDPVWVSSNGGILFHTANHIKFDPVRYPDYGKYPAEEWRVEEIEQRFWSSEFKSRQTTSRLGSLYGRDAMAYIVSHPFHFLKNSLIKLSQRFCLLPYTPERVFSWKRLDPRTVKLYAVVVFYGLLLAGVAGLVYLCRNRRDPGNILMIWCFIYFTGICTLMHYLGSGRLTLSLRLFLLFFTATFLSMVWQKFRNRFF